MIEEEKERKKKRNLGELNGIVRIRGAQGGFKVGYGKWNWVGLICFGLRWL